MSATGATASNPVRDSIDDLIKDSNLPRVQPSDLAHVSSAMPNFLTIEPLEYSKEEDKARKKAKKIMDSLLKFYLSEEMINDSEYIKAKAAVTMASLTTLYSQIKLAEHTIMTIHKKIHTGDFSARMFEVFATLQSQMLDFLKMETMQLIANEEMMKKLRNDLDFNTKRIEPTSESTNKPGSPIRGTRGLMKDIQSEIDESFDDPEPDDPESDV